MDLPAIHTQFLKMLAFAAWTLHPMLNDRVPSDSY